MASTEQLAEIILNTLSSESNGLEVAQIIEKALAQYDDASPRGIRNLINEMSEKGLLVRWRRSATGPGAPPFIYYHPDLAPRQLNLLDLLEGARLTLHRSLVELEELLPEERERMYHYVLFLKYCLSHVNQDLLAKAIIDIAPAIADEQPVNAQMAQWVVNSLNGLEDGLKPLP
jgi:hypothetical protein